MLAAAVEAVEDVGYARMTVAQVIGRARVSRKTFYDVFADREDCFLAAFDHAIDQARAQAKESYDRESDWRNGIRISPGSASSRPSEQVIGSSSIVRGRSLKSRR
jgi:AcrR family transcriptional regulator